MHCVVIKGYSKSAGYQPGVRFEDNRFRNSWNAVYVAGAWRFVQCNWGARHLVNAKDAPKPGNRGKSDSLRYVRGPVYSMICNGLSNEDHALASGELDNHDRWTDDLTKVTAICRG